MSFLLLSVVGITLGAAQENSPSGRMIDADTGQVIMLFPMKKNNTTFEFEQEKIMFGDNDLTNFKSTIFYNEKEYLSGPPTKTETKVISCSKDGSCDGGVKLEKSTSSDEILYKD